MLSIAFSLLQYRIFTQEYTFLEVLNFQKNLIEAGKCINLNFPTLKLIFF